VGGRWWLGAGGWQRGSMQQRSEQTVNNGEDIWQ
jgi:hypothetical protein